MAADRNESETTPEYLSVAQVARRLGCSVSLVQKWRRLGWLPATRLGPQEVPVYGYRLEDVDRFVAERWNRRRGRPPGAKAAGAAPAATPPAVPSPTAIPPATRHPGAAPPLGAAAPPAGRGVPRPAHDTRPPSSPLPPRAAPPATSPTSATPATSPASPTSATPATSSEPSAAAPPTPSAAAPPAPPAGSPPGLATTGRPLVLWDADPRTGSAMVLARFPAAELRNAVDLAQTWARSYPRLVLGETPPPGESPNVLVTWTDGEATIHSPSGDTERQT